MYSGSNIPFQSQAGESFGSAALYWSKPENAVLIPKTIAPGYGVLRAGTIMAKITTATRKDMLVPYVPSTDPTRTDPGALLGKSMLVVDYASAATVCYVTIQDSYKFTVGDDLMLMRNNAASPEYHAGGAISAIDLTTDPSRAKITFTTGVANANFTVANKVCAYVASGTSTKFNLGVYVLDQDVNTGVGADAVGAGASVIMGNAALMLPVVTAGNYDAQAKTDLGAVEDGVILYLK